MILRGLFDGGTHSGNSLSTGPESGGESSGMKGGEKSGLVIMVYHPILISPSTIGFALVDVGDGSLVLPHPRSGDGDWRSPRASMTRVIEVGNGGLRPPRLIIQNICSKVKR